jgi:DNA-directed RNA polymerase specialized sigma24 family protein
VGRPAKEDFVAFAERVEPRLRLAVVAAYGPYPGLDAVQEALVWAWEHWDRVTGLRNPAGYLYRIAMRKAGRMRPRRPSAIPTVPDDAMPWVEPSLSPALESMSAMQRQVVVLVAAYEYTQQETADLLGVRRTTVQTHLDRGLARLRTALGVSDA